MGGRALSEPAWPPKILAASANGANKVGRIDPSSGAITSYNLPSGAGGLGDLTVGGDGNIYFVEQARPSGRAVGDIVISFSLPGWRPGRSISKGRRG